MPEIAEIRWLVHNLNEHLPSAQIERISVSFPKIVKENDKPFTVASEAEAYLNGQFVKHIPEGMVNTSYGFKWITNRGKYILFTISDLMSEKVLLYHCSFTGWVVPSWAEQISPRRFLHPMDLKHTKILIETNRGKIHFTDPRALSNMHVFPNRRAALSSRFLKDMGPDADTDEGILALTKGISKTGRRIRDVILDQKVVAGIGNYLAAEILYEAKLNGHEIAKGMTSVEKVRLYGAVRKVIALACTEDSHDWWNVFQKKTCPLGHPVTREAWGARGHYLCYACQGRPVGVKLSNESVRAAESED